MNKFVKITEDRHMKLEKLLDVARRLVAFHRTLGYGIRCPELERAVDNIGTAEAEDIHGD